MCNHSRIKKDFGVQKFLIEKNIFYVYIENNQKEFRLKIDKDFDFENRELYCFLVNTKKLIPGFVVNFLCSDYGNKSFKLVESEFCIQSIDLLMRDVLIPVPILEIQQKITAINEKFTKISGELNQLKEILAFKPISSESQAAKLDQIYAATLSLRSNEDLFSLLRYGEGEKIEFKETYSFDVRTKQKNKELIHECMKTIAGFMNFNGGTLLVGINDSGEVTGLNNEIEKLWKGTRDSFFKNFVDTIKNTLGSKFAELITFSWPEKDDMIVFKVGCKKSEEIVYCNEGAKQIIYRRFGPRTEKLEGQALVAFAETKANERA